VSTVDLEIELIPVLPRLLNNQPFEKTSGVFCNTAVSAMSRRKSSVGRAFRDMVDQARRRVVLTVDGPEIKKTNN